LQQHPPPDPVPAAGPDPDIDELPALEPPTATVEPTRVEPPPPLLRCQDPPLDPGVINPGSEHEIVFDPDTSDDESNDHVDPGPDDNEEVDPTEADDDEPAPHEEPLRRSSRANRGINSRHQDFLALTATVLMGNKVHPTLA
jgi:hypothetical protein